MAFVSNPYDLLLEAASNDLAANTEGHIVENTIRQRLNSIDEVSEDIVISAEMVPVIKVNEGLLVEMNSVAGYMRTNNIKSVMEALDNIASVNSLPAKSIGLLMESDEYLERMLESANKKKDKNAKNKILDKVKKATDLGDKLKKNGYDVKKKKSKKPVDECNDGNC